MSVNLKNNFPDIVIIAGMPRTGTTTLYHNLQKHPSFFLPFRKEVHYFLYHYDRGLDWYYRLYKNAKPDQVAFDISPNYFFHYRTIDRIKQFDPNMKVILCVRDPAEWALSFYNQRATYDLEMPPFADFLHSYRIRLGSEETHLEFQNKVVIRMLEAYREAFGDNLLLYHFKLYQEALLSVLQAIEAFVGVSPYFNPDNFDNVSINAGNRINNVFLYRLLSHENFISLLHRTLPEGMVRFLRRMYDLAVINRKSHSMPHQKHSPEDVELAEETFANERQAIAEIFAEHQMQLGTGTPFPQAKPELLTARPG